MSQIFSDDFDDGQVGQPPSNWTVSGIDVTVQDDPAPDYQGDLAMRMIGASATVARATREFGVCAKDVVELNLKVYILNATTPSLGPIWAPFYLQAQNFAGTGDGIALTLAFMLDRDGNRKFAISTSESGYIHLANWQFETWHELKLRFTLTEPQIWEFSPLHRVEIEFDGETVSYGYYVSPNITGLDRLQLTANSVDEDPGEDVSYLNCTAFVDDVSASQGAWEMPSEYECPADRFCWLDALDLGDIEAQKFIPLSGFIVPNNYDTGFEPENMNHPHLGKAWHSLDPNPDDENYTIADHVIDIDFGESTLIEAVSILNHNLADLLYMMPGEPWREVVLLAKDDAGGDWEYKLWLLDLLLMGFFLRAISGGDVRAPLGMTNATVFPNESYRHWRLLIRQYRPRYTDGTSQSYFKIGRLLMGTINELAYNYDYEWALSVDDPSAETESVTGAKWFRELATRRRVNINFSLDDESWPQIEAQFAALRRVPKLYILAPVEPEEVGALSIYGTLSKNPMSVEIKSLQDHLWDYELEIAEEVW